MLHRGNELWPDQVTGDLKENILSEGRKIVTYSGCPKNLYGAFAHTVRRLPDKAAVVDNWGRVYTYQRLYEKVQRFSTWLYGEMSVRRGKHVAVMLFNSVEFCVAFLALNRIGAAVVPLPTKYKKEEVCALMEKSDVDIILSDEAFTHYFDAYQGKIQLCIIPNGKDGYALEKFSAKYGWNMEEIEKRTSAEDLALLMFTSGTTSQSKGVTIRNYNVMHAIISYQKTLGITEEDRAIIPIPIYLITGLVAVFGLMIYVGGVVYLNRVFQAERVLEDVEKYQITFLHASPTVFTLLLGQRSEFPELPSLRMFACGSSNMPPGKIRILKAWLPQCEFRTVYGLTETTSPATIFPSDANASPYIGSSGIPIPGTEFKIVDDDGRELPEEIEGRILIRGSNITDAYYKMDLPSLQDGWLDTGDIGYFNKDSYLYIVDRKKDMINRGGEKICSFDVENEIAALAGVEDAAVVGIPDELYGEIPVAVVKLRQGSVLTAERIREILKKRIAGYKIPVEIRMIQEIPVTENLKTDKKKIRRMFAEGKGDHA